MRRPRPAEVCRSISTPSTNVPTTHLLPGTIRERRLSDCSIEAFGGGEYAGAAVFIDAHFGAGLTGGFAYNFDFHPFGLSLYDTNEGKISLGLTTGIQLQGVTGRQFFRTAIPLRLFLNFKIQSWAYVHVWGGIDTNLGDSRSEGSKHALWADELRTGMRIRLGPNRSKKMGSGRLSSGNGYFVGTTYSERLGLSFWGFVVGPSSCRAWFGASDFEKAARRNSAQKTGSGVRTRTRTRTRTSCSR